MVAWLDRQAADSIWITSITVFEVRFGLAVLAAGRQRAGRPLDLRDTLIAGVVVARRATLATWNTRHFADVKVPVVNPWLREP